MNESLLKLYQDLLKRVDSAPLSQTLPKALRLARELKQTDFEKWLRLEIGGYLNSNPAISDDVKVPKYRNVSGQHLDMYERPIRVASDLQYLNSIPLRNGIDELEKLANKTNTLVIQESISIEFIKENFNVDTYGFRFNPLEISGILSSIKLKLDDWLFEMQSSYPELSQPIEINKISQNIKLDFSQIGKVVVSILLLSFALVGFVWLPFASAILWLIFLIVSYPVALSFTTAKQSMDNNNLVEMYKAGLKQVPIIGKLFGNKPQS